MAESHSKRRIKLIRPGLQARLVLSIIGIATLALLMEVILLGMLLTSLATELPVAGQDLVEHIPVLLIQAFSLSVLLFLPLLLWVGVHKSFRVAGPIAKFESYLADVRAGRATGPCSIRATDELHELCGAINQTLAVVRERALAEGQESEQDRRAG